MQVWRVSWSVMGNILAVSQGDQKVSLWKEARTFPHCCLAICVQHMCTEQFVLPSVVAVVIV